MDCMNGKIGLVNTFVRSLIPWFSDRWLQKQFEAADANSSGALTFEETCRLLKNMNVDLPRARIQQLFDEANKETTTTEPGTEKKKKGGKQVLDLEEFQLLYRLITNHPTVRTSENHRLVFFTILIVLYEWIWHAYLSWIA